MFDFIHLFTVDIINTVTGTDITTTPLAITVPAATFMICGFLYDEAGLTLSGKGKKWFAVATGGVIAALLYGIDPATFVQGLIAGYGTTKGVELTRKGKPVTVKVNNTPKVPEMPEITHVPILQEDEDNELHI